MSLRDEWLPRARADLLSIPDWREAARVAAAVLLLARDDIGFVRHIRRDDGPDEWRLHMPGRRSYVLIRRSPTTLYVERVILRP